MRSSAVQSRPPPSPPPPPQGRRARARARDDTVLARDSHKIHAAERWTRRVPARTRPRDAPGEWRTHARTDGRTIEHTGAVTAQCAAFDSVAVVVAVLADVR